jgi:hypothetical protein
MKFTTDSNQLTITLEGWEILWGLKRRLVIPKSAIASVSWRAEYKHTGSLFRVVGTGAPLLLYAGYFRANGQRAYLYMKKPKGMSWTSYGEVTAPNIVAITTKDYKYPLVLLTASPEDGQRLADWAAQLS